MPATYTSSLRLTQPANGDTNWGTTVNTGVTSLVDDAVAGTATITIAGTDYTLSNLSGSADEARKMFITATGSPGANRNVICPAVSKLYVFTNSVTGGYSVTLKTASGTGVTVPNGRTLMLRCDGTNVFVAADELYTPAGAGAVVTTVQNKLREIVSVKDFGAVGDGVTDDSAAVQAAVNALSSGGTLSFPFGTYKLNTSILIATSNLNIVGNGSTIDATTMTYSTTVRGNAAVFRFVSPNATHTKTLTATANAGTNQLTLSSSSNLAVGQLISCLSTEIQYRNDTAIAYYVDQNKIVNISGSTVTLESPLQYTLSVSAGTVTATHRTPIANFSVDNFVMLGGGVRTSPIANGVGLCGIWGECVEKINVTNCKFYGFQGIAVGIEFFADVVVADCYFEGVSPNTVIVEGQNSGFYAVYTLRGRRSLFTRCVGQRVRHLFDAYATFQIIQSDSVASNTHRGAFGSHENVYDLNIVGNVSYSCYAGVILRALTANVVGNTFTAGTGNNSNWTGFTQNLAITMSLMTHTDPGRAQFLIDGNRVYSYGTGTGAFAGTASCNQLTITNNLFAGGAPAISFNNANMSLENVVIKGNTLLFDGSVANTTGIAIVSPLNGTIKNWLISNNICRNYAFSMILLKGCTDVTNPAEYIKITDNLGYSASGANQPGVYIYFDGYYGEDIVINNNSMWGDGTGTATNVCNGQNYRLRAYPVVEKNDEVTKTNQANRSIIYASSSAPTILNDATLLRGSVIENTLPSSGAPDHWVVATSGTNGSIAGVTGDITSGTNILTLTGNDSTKVYAGSYISVAGSGLTRVRVNSIDATFTTATLSSNASTTVTGAAVNRANPVIVASANLV